MKWIILLLMLIPSIAHTGMNSYTAGKPRYQHISHVIGTKVTLEWDANKESGVIGYYLYEDHKKIATVETNTFTLHLTPGKHVLWVTAYNEYGESKASNRLVLIIKETHK